jgi:hypothetical protein
MLNSPESSIDTKDIALLDREVFYVGSHAATA